MKNSSKFLLVAIVVGSVVVALGLSIAAQAPAKAPARPVFRTAAQLKWVDVPDAKGVQEAVLWGDPAKGAHGSQNRFAAGTELPLHTHTNSMRGVILSGTLVITPEGGKAAELGPGSYFLAPGGMNHMTSCKAGADCVVYLHMSGAFDMKPSAAPK